MKTLLFTVVSLLAFTFWAFGASLFNHEWQLYTACAATFLLGGGLSLLPGSGYQSKREATIFIGRFTLGFLAYAVIWSVAWFTFRNTFGEITGSFLGIIAMAAILGNRKGFPGGFLSGVAIIFLWHTVGYYTGGFLYEMLQNRGTFGVELGTTPKTVTHIARLAWGLGYGAGLGYGLSRWLQLSRQA
ncbi:MAG: hypothetical protein P1U86_08900 [Verrucomicrobiales bacterium]|nr:hypothetical protein [Verrucomicrobiales bacterium]